ncbi:hypothetical protein CDAR_259411 [Caerostris darwini]|uniref:Ribosomal protein L15 n=1 Tax=Caerostris darwini TaxID=1538125 RepID=A0AAV4VQG1_9ARAC|nr:hypothetical protein CDAR_259411 [Caerostris darwini]
MSFLDIRVTARRRSDYHTRDTITTSTAYTHTRQYSVLWQRVDVAGKCSEGGKKIQPRGGKTVAKRAGFRQGRQSRVISR